MEGLVRCSANYVPLSPVRFLERTAKVYRDRTSVVYGSLKYTWSQTHQRCLKLASALTQLGICRGDVDESSTRSVTYRAGGGRHKRSGSGYLKDLEATEEAFHGGWFRSGDLAVKHPDGYMEVKDRSKDIKISGGENISTVEVETVLFSHPAVLEVAVVARPDNHWGQTPVHL
ncbi:hypothetical protein EZV62_014465 [Acer yangbiense]|uniref:AMP-binding enzyme C-terminal domain-containing protein n=1 Tax=Acer yangbiense TaxID=1000413 RepID=A0A5C7HUP7_9ROSI|nr:hypothetical protein EZV62_014465 [Acer yangbiense]